MITLTPAEIQKAYRLWYLKYYTANENNKSIDQELSPFLNPQMKASLPNGKPGPANTWLLSTRKALFLSGESVAERLGISRAAYAKFESAEPAGKITLGSLARVAEAMDCELVYAIRPKSKVIHSQAIWKKLFKASKNHPWLKNSDPRKKAEVLLSVVCKKMQDGEFRRSQSWSQHKN